VNIIYTINHTNPHTSAACDSRCLVKRIDTVDIFVAYLFVGVDTIDLNTRDGGDVTQGPGRGAASGSHPSREKTRLSPIYVPEALFVCQLAFRVISQALLSSSVCEPASVQGDQSGAAVKFCLCAS